jgi:hypothetical protein
LPRWWRSAPKSAGFCPLQGFAQVVEECTKICRVLPTYSGGGPPAVCTAVQQAGGGASRCLQNAKFAVGVEWLQCMMMHHLLT